MASLLHQNDEDILDNLDEDILDNLDEFEQKHLHLNEFEQIQQHFKQEYNILQKQLCILHEQNLHDDKFTHDCRGCDEEKNKLKYKLEQLYHEAHRMKAQYEHFTSSSNCAFEPYKDAKKRVMKEIYESGLYQLQFASENSKIKEDQRISWDIGSRCKIYSNSTHKWHTGKITNISNDKEGEWLTVSYNKFKKKEVQRLSRYIKPISNNNTNDDKKEDINKNKTTSSLSDYIHIFINAYDHDVDKKEKLSLYVKPTDSVTTLKLLIECRFKILAECQELIFEDLEITHDFILSTYDIKDGTMIQLKQCEPKKLAAIDRERKKEPLCTAIADIQYDDLLKKIVIGDDSYLTPIDIKSYHVSCQSDKINGDNMGGVVLYSYDNQNDWILNNIHCKSGYIILKLYDNIKDIQSNYGILHGACYKSVFKQEIDDKVVGGGFAFYNGKWKFNSGTFNYRATQYHDDQKAMHPLEQKCIEAAIENWKKGIQNTECKDIFNKNNINLRYCPHHGSF
eukprot:556325_1